MLFATGVTRFFPTVNHRLADDMQGALRNLADARKVSPRGEAMEGVHVEGPHISPEMDLARGAGAHPRRWVRAAGRATKFTAWQDAARGHIALVTLAPEWPEVGRAISRRWPRKESCRDRQHQRLPDPDRGAVQAGATLSTHLG